MVVDVAGYVACCPLYACILRVLVDPLFLGVPFVQPHDLVEELLHVKRTFILGQAHRMLAVELENYISREGRLPIDLDDDVVISWV